MSSRRLWGVILGGGLVAAAGWSLVTDAMSQPPPAAREGADRPADREVIRQAAADFAAAFDRGDAPALAAAWTENGEYTSDTGEVLRGRAAIEKAYAEHFKENPGGKIDVDIQSVYFPSRDTAVEEGTLRVRPSAGADLPTSTRYSVLHVREDGKWKMALAREWGAAADKLEDLAWLAGEWVARGKGRDMQMTFTWNETKNTLRGRFTVKEGDRTATTGTQTIRLDPVTGQPRSWLFDEEGGRGEALWFRDGNRWVQECVGVLPDGTPTASFNILTRLDADNFLWRSVERTVGGESAPDTTPIKVSRVQTAPAPSKK